MAKRKKKRLKIKRLLLLIIIVLIIFFIVRNKDKNDKKIDNKNVTNIVEKTTYLNNITNKSSKELDNELKKIIVSYMDLYIKSLVNLKSENVTNLFTESDSVEAYLTQTTIDLQVYHHSIQLNDMKLNDAYYDIEITNIKEKDNIVTVDYLENDYYKFKYLNNITSRIIDVENTMILKYNNGKYTIESIRVIRDNYVIFTNLLNSNFSKEDIDNLKNKYTNYINEENNKNKELLNIANSEKYIPSRVCDHSYDRNASINYSYQYVENKNPNYFDYSLLGGNCANFASQSIHAGGIPMDYTGKYQWKYYSDALNTKDEEKGRSASWVATYYFYEYAKNNKDSGLCSEVDVNLFYAESGDVIHVGYKEDNHYSHTTLVTKVIKNNDKIVDILVNSNTTGLKDYPVLGYIYQYKRLIKILGYND